MPAAPPPDEPTVAWDLARVLLVASTAALIVGAWFALRPIENPGVQDCGAPLRFVVLGDDAVVPIGVPGAPPNAPELRAQPPCSELVVPQLERSALFTAACVVLGLTGTALGLLDDRIRLHRAPPFEQLVRERPVDAPTRALDPVPTRPDDLGEALPAIEPAEVALLGVGAALAVVGLPVLVGASATWSALRRVDLVAAVVLVALAALARLAAGAGRWMALDAESPLAPGDRAPLGAGSTPGAASARRRGWLGLAVASAWAARARPETGVYGLDVHHLVKAEGVPRPWAAARVASAASVALVVHLVVLAALAAAGAPSSPEPDDRAYLLLLGACAVGVLLGLGRAPRVWRALAVRPSVAAFGASLAPARLGRAAGAAAGGAVQIALEVAVVAVAVAAVGADLGVGTIALAWVVAVSVGIASPLPAGAGLTEAVLALVLWRWGVAPGAAVAAALLARAVTFWLPVVPGTWADARLRRRGEQ